MKTLHITIALLLTFLWSLELKAQNYPADPSIATITSDMKKDEVTKQLLESYGYDPALINKGKIRMAQKSELKDYFYTKWYWRSDDAYKVSLNKNYMDMRSFSTFLVTPKDAKGISHKIFFKVTYTRRTPQDFEDNKWNYEYLLLDPIECESYGLPKLTDDERKKMMMDYIMANRKSNETLMHPQHPINNIIKVDSVMAYSHSYQYYKNLSATKFHWGLSILGEYITDKTAEGGAERVDRDYFIIPFEATYNNGSYSLQPMQNGWVKNYLDPDAPGFEVANNAGLIRSVKDMKDDPQWFETLADRSFEELMQQKYKVEQPVGSEAFIEKRMEEINTALKTLESGDGAAVVKALKPFMNPKNADALAKSYGDLIQSFTDKVCTLEVTRTQGDIPYSYEFGDTEGPYIDLTISIRREAARDKETKKKYKAAGMSSSVLKSTSRGSEYGKLSNKSYDQKLELVLIDGNWYINQSADQDEVKIAF
ncbi:MAG: hypothetical protein NXI10_08940 [bacterium]|nr:hypothetical protein [bacterium]